MDDRETELSRFRQQWQAEVTARTHPTTTASSSSSSHPKPAPFAPRRLSHHNPAPDPDPGSDADDDDDHDHDHDHDHERAGLLPLQRERERSASPQATRRSAPPPSALEHYEKAVEKETQGSLGESLSLYRKAFRMDAKVDSQYRDKYYPRPAGASASSSAAAAHTTTTTTTAAAAQKQPPASIAALIKSFAHLAVPAAGTEDTAVYAPLSTLPHELLLHIMHTLATSDVASFARCAKVCKALAHVVVTEEAIWRDVCAAAFAKMAWDWRVSVDGTPLIHRVLCEGEGGSPLPLPLPPTATPAPDAEAGEAEEEEEEMRPTPTDDAHLPTYGGSWRAMFQSRPRIRFNGVYISTCNYVRQGASQSGWNTPVHIVTYYRYLRFHDDGTVLSLLTSCEPAEVVHGFSRAGVQGGGAAGGTGVLPSAVARYVARGRWRVDERGRVDVETVQRGMERYLFRMQLRLGSVRSGGRWVGSRKLAWEGFWSWNRMTDDLAEFSLRNDKAFIFSRVGSIERELGLS
ncbi:hypothetical protein DFP73DRAFT_530986 [Morchella snyderi]|nr:hypothetical protein DFP73DRAFT_530986 [Morchella snyderi]